MSRPHTLAAPCNGICNCNLNAFIKALSYTVTIAKASKLDGTSYRNYWGKRLKQYIRKKFFSSNMGDVVKYIPNFL